MKRDKKPCECVWVRVVAGVSYSPGYRTDVCVFCRNHRSIKVDPGPHQHDWYDIPDPGGYVGQECYTCGINRDTYEETAAVRDETPIASDGGSPMIFRPATRSQRTTCAGRCDGTCDAQARCSGCQRNKVDCDAQATANQACCTACTHG